MNEKIKVVLDTQIFLRALINKNSGGAKIASREWRNFYVLYTADKIDAEIIDILNRREIRMKFPQITDRQINLTVKLLQDEAVRVELRPEDIERVCRDPNDDIFLACAKVAQADYPVSDDNELLVIGQHHSTKLCL